MRSYAQYCPVAKATEVLGDRWTLLIVREMLGGASGFNELERGLPGISRSVLTDRMRALERGEVVGRCGRQRDLRLGGRCGTRLIAGGQPCRDLRRRRPGARVAGQHRLHQLDQLLRSVRPKSLKRRRGGGTELLQQPRRVAGPARRPAHRQGLSGDPLDGRDQLGRRPTLELDAAKPPANDLVIAKPPLEVPELAVVPRPFRDESAQR